jgi:hypothetical protein
VAAPAALGASDAASLSSEKASLVSFHSTGIAKLTERIYVAQEEARQARLLTRQVARDYAHDPEKLQGAVSSMNHATSFCQGLVAAWELVTGEIWGQASWQMSR